MASSLAFRTRGLVSLAPVQHYEADHDTGCAADPAAHFTAIADAIGYRWTVERDTWVSRAEVEHARAYLAQAGVPTRAHPDGGFVLEGEPATVLSDARVVLLGIRRVLAARRHGR
jgi:hypothetical protein